MQVKRFVAADMRRALELVRLEMGADAVILSSRRVKEGVEIVTTLEEQPQVPSSDQGLVPREDHSTGFESPLNSDSAWGDQAKVNQAINERVASANNAAQQVSAQQASLNTPDNRQPESVAAPSFQQALQGAAAGVSGKSSQQLAEEIEQARARMLAARKAQSVTVGEVPTARGVPTAGGMPTVGEVGAANGGVGQQPVETETSIDRGMPQRQDPYEREQQLKREEQLQQEQAHLRREQERLEEEKLALERKRQQQEQDAQRQAEQDQQFDAMRSELADMRQLLEEQLGFLYAEQAPVAQTPVHGALWSRYERMGLPMKAIVQVLTQTPQQGSVEKVWPESLAALSHQLPIQDGDIVDGGGVFAFVGPTGVGKTTTIGKLAARYVLKHGADKVALVTTDNYRIAAHDQLRSLGRILKVPVNVVNSYEELPQVLRSLRDYPLVLVDTAGLRPGDPQLKQQLQALSQLPEIQTYLVMATTSQQQMLKASVHAYKSAGLQGCVLTKLDESASLGETLGVVLDQKLAVAYTTDGQEIPKDIDVARAYHLVSRAVSLMKQSSGKDRAPAARVANADTGSDSASRLSRAVSMVKQTAPVETQLAEKRLAENRVAELPSMQTINDRQGVQELGHA